MQTDMSNIKRHGISAIMRSSLISALAVLPLCVAAGCGVDAAEEGTETTSEAQPVTGGCIVLRPYGWNGLNAACVGTGTTTLQLAPGQSVTFFSTQRGTIGQCSVTVVCHSNGDGGKDEVNKSCVLLPGGNGGGGQP